MMTNNIYIGVDPGRVSAAAFYDPCEGVTLQHATGDLITIGQWIEERITGAKVIVSSERIIIACERYTMGSTTRSHQPDALEVIGMCRWLAHEWSTKFVIQGAAEAAKVGNRQTLVDLGWWIPGDEDNHRNRASAQVAMALQQYEPHRWIELTVGSHPV